MGEYIALLPFTGALSASRHDLPEEFFPDYELAGNKSIATKNTNKYVSIKSKLRSKVWTICCAAAATVLVSSLLFVATSYESHGGIRVPLDENEQKTLNAYEQEFSLEGIDFETPAPCGRHKCYFQPIGNDKAGYLAAESADGEKSYAAIMNIGYELAKYLETKYNIKHFLLAPPKEIAISDRLAEKLNMNLFHPGTGKRKKKWADRFLNETSVVVQKVKSAPSPAAFIRNHPNTQKYIYDNFKEFLTSVPDMNDFVMQFKKELDEASELIEKEPFYATDFQALVDTGGHLHHIDFDVFKPQNKTPASVEELRNTSPQDVDKTGRSLLEWQSLAHDSFNMFLRHAESAI